MAIDDAIANDSNGNLVNNTSLAGTVKNIVLHTGKSVIHGLVGNSKK